jgi:hypothetical protein
VKGNKVNFLLIFALSSFLVGVTLMFVADKIFYYMLGEVNAKLEPERQFHLLGINIAKVQAVWNEHSRLFPESNRRFQEATCFVIGALCHVIALVAFLLS